MCRSDPHTPARVSRTRRAPGSTSGTGYSRRSNSPPYARSTATRPFMGTLLVLWPARRQHDGVQRDSCGRIAELDRYRSRRRPLDVVQRLGAAGHDGAENGIAADESSSRVGRGRTGPRFLERRHLDLPEAGLPQHLPDRRGIMEAERHGVEHRRVSGEKSPDRLVSDPLKWVLGDGIPYAEEVGAAGLEHAKGLADARRLVGEEHQPELADHDVEGLVGERK